MSQAKDCASIGPGHRKQWLQALKVHLGVAAQRRRDEARVEDRHRLRAKVFGLDLSDTRDV